MRRDPDKLREWQRRSKPLARSGPPKRKRSSLRVEKPRKRRRPVLQFGEQADVCRYLQCCVCRRYSLEASRGRASDLEMAIASAIAWRDRYGKEARVSDPHHVRTRGAGGLDHDCVPLCRTHHVEIDGINSGRLTFAKKHGVDLPAIAVAIAEVLARRATKTSSCMEHQRQEQRT